MSNAGSKSMATLDDLMLSVGVVNYPQWMSQVEIPNWPFPHQMDTFKEYVRAIRYGDFSDPGTGKTYPAQLMSALMASLGNKVVFTMPPKLIRQFIGEYKEFFPGLHENLSIDHLDVGAVQKTKRMERWDKEGWPDILLISYDVFRSLNSRAAKVTVGRNQWKLPNGENYWTRDENGNQVPKDRSATPHTKDGNPITFRKGKAKAQNNNQMRLKNSGYEVFFFDEAHALCNPESIAWKSLQHMDHTLGDDIAVYLMTGTPVPTHLEDVYGLIRILDRTAYTNKTQFDRKHVILNPNTQFRHVLGYKDEETVYKHLYKRARRVQKRDVSNLEDPLITSTPIQLAGKHKQLYDKILRDRFAVLGDKVLAPDNDSALRNLALQIISCPDEFDDTGGIGKENELTKWLDDKLESINPANHKVIIFAHYKSTIQFLAKRYKAWNPAVMNGATTAGWKEVDRFKEDDSCRLFVVNWASGGAGLNLQVAHHIAFYEVPTSPKDAKQAIARADRTGQFNMVNVYFPRVIGTLFDRNFKNLLKNERQNNKVVRDKHDLLYEQLKVTRKAA